MSVAQTFLRLQHRNDMRVYLYTVGEMLRADHIERSLVGCSAVWVDAQQLPPNQQDAVWDQLQLTFPNHTPEDILRYVFNLSVASNSPGALQRVCEECSNTSENSEVFTKICQLLKDLQNFPILPVRASDFCEPLLRLITNPHHIKTLTQNTLHGVHTQIQNNKTHTTDVLQCVVDYAVSQNISADIMAELIFTSVSQWNVVAQHAPHLVKPLINAIPFKSTLLHGGVPYQKCRSFDKWERFLIHGNSPAPIEMEDSGFPFTLQAHKTWLEFLDELIPLYENFGHNINLLEYKGLEEMTRNQSGLAVSAYQKQKLTEVVSTNNHYASKISKI